MSYVDGNSSNRRKALTGGTAALIEVGLALALIKGFTVAFIQPAPPPPLTGTQISLPPPPPKPVDEPPVRPEKPVVKDTFIDRPMPKIPVPQDTQTDAKPQLPLSPPGDLGGGPVVPQAGPSEPSARFTPKAARPHNDIARWVTTDDYPTSDIRAGHTGTVRFRLAIDSAGRVTDCAIVESSGYPGLDAATCRNVAKRARFDPAANATGERVAGSYTGTIYWVIPRD